MSFHMALNELLASRDYTYLFIYEYEFVEQIAGNGMELVVHKML